MSKNVLLIVAVVLIAAGFVLILFGLRQNPLLWQAGLIVIVLAMIASLATRWTKSEEKTKKKIDVGEKKEPEKSSPSK